MRNFEDLFIYHRAREITRDIYRQTRMGRLKTDFGLSSQMQRAAVSIVSNIVEGCERGGDVEFRRYLIIAKGSAGELRAQLAIAHDVGFMSRSEFEILYDTVQRLGCMIASLIAALARGAG